MSAVAVSEVDARRVGHRDDSNKSWRAAVVAAGRRWSAGQRELIGLVAALDASGEWALDGAATCAHWIAGAVDVEVCTAREWLRIGHALAGLSVIDEAFGDGRLSYSKVRSLTRVADASNEVELCELAQRVPAGRLTHALAAWVLRHESPGETEARHHDARRLSWHVDCDGMVTATFRLPAHHAAIVTGAVDAAVMCHRPRAAERGPDASADACWPQNVTAWPSVSQQRADALVALVAGGGTHISTEIVLHVRGEDAASTTAHQSRTASPNNSHRPRSSGR